jgi:hypothetical protein
MDGSATRVCLEACDSHNIESHGYNRKLHLKNGLWHGAKRGQGLFRGEVVWTKGCGGGRGEGGAGGEGQRTRAEAEQRPYGGELPILRAFPECVSSST